MSARAAGVEEAQEYMYERQTDAALQSDTDAPLETTADWPIMTPPATERDGYMIARIEDLTAKDLTGARVYGFGDEDVGNIDELLLTDDGEMDRAVIGVGNFLGMCERPVAVTSVVRKEDGSDLRVYIDSSQEALEQQPEYDG